MIDIEVFFNKEDMTNVLGRLLGLPEPILPVYFGEQDDKFNSKDKITDKQKFDEFIKDNSLGFFLQCEKCLYSVNYHPVGYQSVNIWISEELQSYIPVLFGAIASHKPVFGYAADCEEINHRNRFYKTIGVNHIESWVGRNIDKYIPGLYCYTLLPDKLLIKHGINLTLIQDDATSVLKFEGSSIHLIQYFEKTKDWEEYAPKLDALCEEAEGIFSIKGLEKSMAGVSNFHDFDSIIANWK